jgi:hypothetical protein
MKMQRANFLRALVFGMGALGVTAMGCELISSVDRTQIPEASGGTGIGGTGGTSSSVGPGTGGAGGIGTGGAGGVGGTGGCMTPADCPATGNECVAATCDAATSTCGTVNVADGMAAQTQTAADCKKNFCDGNGNIASQNDDTDAFDDSNECTTDACSNGAPTHNPVGSGTPCTMGGIKCNATGQCVACLNDTDCTAPEVCQANKCVASACQNLVKDGMETDVDCGGPDCGPCANNKVCLMGSDCQSLVCSGAAGMMKCAAPTCTDMTKNQMETDADCGGPNCPDCANGQACVTNDDCVSKDCVGGTCSESCMDGMKTGLETDVDCGGVLCPDCGDGKMCLLPTDCVSNICPLGGGTCQPQASGAGGMGGMGAGGAGMGGAGGN